MTNGDSMTCGQCGKRQSAGTGSVRRGHKFRLYPSSDQQAVLERYAGVTRLVYNLAREQRETFWRQYRRATGRTLSFAAQSTQIKDLRAAFDFIAEVPFDALDAALKDLDGAYAAFFAGRARYPQYRRKGESDAFRLKGISCRTERLNAKWGQVYVPKLGFVKFRASRAILGEIKSVTFSRRDGWWVSFAAERPAEALAGSADQVGIDRGIARTLTLSNGEHIQAPDTLALLRRRKRAQKVLAHRKRGSRRYAAQRAKVARLNARMVRIRTDWSHRASTDIARRFGLVAIEALKIQNMTASAAGTIEAPGRNVRQKAGLNRRILEQCWGRFAAFLDYKLSERGGVLISVPAAYSSQTCASCGVVDARSRKSQADFNCVHCGHADNADVNAAKEILRRSTAPLGAEAGLARPVKRQPQETAHAA